MANQVNSDKAKAALSVVRREEENNDRKAIEDAQTAAIDFNDDSALPGNNDAADIADGTARTEHARNAARLASVGASNGYERRSG